MTSFGDRNAGRKPNRWLLARWERSAAIVQSAVDAFIVVDEKGRILLFNDAAERMFGCQEQQVIGSRLEALIAPRFRAELASGVERVRETEPDARSRATASTLRGVRANGEEFSCEASIARHDVAGRPEFSVAIRDTTERSQTDETLHRLVDFETFLFDLSRTFTGLPEEKVDAHMVQGLARVGEFLNMDRVTMLELSPGGNEMVVAYSWGAAGVPHVNPRITKQEHPWWVGQVLQGAVSLAAHVDDLPEEAGLEKEYLRQRGVASVASIPLSVGGEIAGAIAFVTTRRRESWNAGLVNQLSAIADILWNALKRRQSMKALQATQDQVRASEERFRLAMNNVAAGVYTLDLRGLATYVNPAAEAMLGWTMGELLGKRMHDVKHHSHPDGTPFPAAACPALQVLHTGVELREHSDMFIRKDGQFFPVVYSASPLKNRDGATVGMVVGFRDDTQHLAAERAMGESEERFRLIANTAPVMIWMSDVDKQVAYVNLPWLNFTGWPVGVVPGHRWIELIHPDDVERCGVAYVKAFDQREPFRVEHRLRRHDGEYRWTVSTGVPRYDGEGSFTGYVGTAIDVTESKLAEDVLSTVSRRLIAAHEEERIRLARDLHDDIGQQLVLLQLYLEVVRQRVEIPMPALGQEIGSAIETVTMLSRDVQNLSRRLHSTQLKQVGLEAAARAVCAELSERTAVDVRFQSESSAAILPDDVSLCLYRVLQEALQNAVKHSRSRHIDVWLGSDASSVELIVRDSGIGFDPNAASQGRGLGLVAMKERLKLVGGDLTIDARHAAGTTIRARVPLDFKA
jgi:PAS domain S-box-containing protein